MISRKPEGAPVWATWTLRHTCAPGQIPHRPQPPEEPPTRTMNGQHPLQRSHRSIPEVEQEAGEDELQDEFAAMRDTKSSRR